MIKQISFKHGWFYHYRVHNLKTDGLTNGCSELNDYLYDMFDNCPHDYFESGPRGSSLKFKLSNLKMIEINGHEVSTLARYGLEENKHRYKSNHSKVQVFMLENDDKTLAVEVPIWLEADEVDYFHNIFKCSEPLTGHIDVLRVDGDKIWIWDYKPNAHREKFAATQTYFYALMLSKRTGIDFKRFRCGYFDDKYAFLFNPNNCKVKKSSFLSDFI